MDAITRVAVLTPPGAGAIASLAIRGPGAWDVTRSLFHPSLPENAVVGKFFLGRFGENKNASDEVVLAVKPDGLELHCHGGKAVVRFILDAYAARGVVECAWRDVLRSLTLPARHESVATSSLRERALELLLQAPTVKTAAILLDQYHGALERALAEIEANGSGTAAQRARLLETQHLAEHLVEPFRVVIAGAPNVGKSSLVNAIAGYTRSIVSPVPGTTRDVVTTRIALDGWPVELIDTAGLRDGGDDLEQAGMERALDVIATADLRLWVLDGSAPPEGPPAVGFETVVNKIDAPAGWDWNKVPDCRVSALTGQGVTELCQRIASLLGLDVVLRPGEALAYDRRLRLSKTENNHVC